MQPSKGERRTCPRGHVYYKSSDCPTCPACERERPPAAEFLALLGAPARRALENAGIGSLQQLSGYTEKEILKWHGIGPASIPALKKALEAEGLSFKP